MLLCMYPYYDAKLLQITIIHQRTHCCVASGFFYFFYHFIFGKLLTLLTALRLKKLPKFLYCASFTFLSAISLSCRELKYNNFQLAFTETCNCRLEEFELKNNAHSLRKTLGMISSDDLSLISQIVNISFRFASFHLFGL